MAGGEVVNSIVFHLYDLSVWDLSTVEMSQFFFFASSKTRSKSLSQPWNENIDQYLNW